MSKLSEAKKSLKSVTAEVAKLQDELDKANADLSTCQQKAAGLKDPQLIRQSIAKGKTAKALAGESLSLAEEAKVAELNIKAIGQALESARIAETIATRKVAELEAVVIDEAAHNGLVNFIDLFNQAAAVIDDISEKSEEMSHRVGHLRGRRPAAVGPERQLEALAPGTIPMTEEEQRLKGKVGNYRTIVKTWRTFQENMGKDLRICASSLEIEAPEPRPVEKFKPDPGFTAAMKAHDEAMSEEGRFQK